MDEYPKLPKETEVLQSLSKVNVARRAANLQIEETDFDERQKRRRTNKNNGAGPKRNRGQNRGGKKTGGTLKEARQGDVAGGSTAE